MSVRSFFIADAVVGDGDPNSAETVRTAEDIVGPQIAIGHIHYVVVDRDLEQQLSAPCAKPDFRLEHAGEFDLVAIDSGDIQPQR